MKKLLLGFLLVLSLCLVQAQNTTVPDNLTMPNHTYAATENTTVGVTNGSGRMDCWTALLAMAAPLLLHRH